MTIEYRTVDTTTRKGLKEAERLHLSGWKQVRVGPFTTQFKSPERHSDECNDANDRSAYELCICKRKSTTY